MDQIKNIPSALPEGIAPTYKALLPKLAANEKEFHKQYAKRETHSYGSDPRQELDIYYPPSTNEQTPVLLFLYGGGFFQGDKRNKQHPNLMYANLAAFFCSKGYISVIADYRLSKGPGNPNGNAKYPSGGEDAVGALNWVAENLGTTRKVFMMGNSAGSVHAMTVMFEPSLLKAVKANLAGVIGVSPPCHQRHAPPERREVNEGYYGPGNATDDYSPFVLMEKNGVVDIPLLSLIAEFEEGGIVKSWGDFKTLYSKRGGKFEELIMEDHNHMSPVLSLNSTEPEGNKWAEDVVEWMAQN